MKIVRLLPVGYLVVMGGGLGCGEGGANPTSDTTAEATAALQNSKVIKAESFVEQTNLLSDPDSKLAPNTEVGFVNAWGLAFDPKTGWAWLSAADGGIAVVVRADGTVVKDVAMPRNFSPTGVVYNGSRAFEGDDFIFVSEEGAIAGAMRDDKSGTPRGPEKIPAGANYKGVTIGSVHGKLRLFVADFGDGTNDLGKVAVFDDDYVPRHHDDAFVDRGIPENYAPFNVLAVGDFLLVTYAQRSEDDAGDDQRGAGFGFVDLFTLEGKLVKELIRRGELNAPWGLALSSERGEKKSVDLLVGNFGDGHINVYEISVHGKEVRADFEGAIFNKKTKQPLEIDGLWGIAFGNGKGDFDVDDLYFNAGPKEESQGLFGELDFVGRRK